MTATTSADAITIIPEHARTVRGSNQPVVFMRDGQVFANSEDVATYFGKRHADVLRDIRNLILQDNSLERNFAFMSRPVKIGNGATREVAACDMDRDGFTVLAMGFTGKRALGWKLAYIRAFNEMERQVSAPVEKPNHKQVSIYEREIQNLKVTVSYLEKVVEELEKNSLDDLIFSHKKKMANLNHAVGRGHNYLDRPELFDKADRVTLALLEYAPRSRTEAVRKASYIKSVPSLSCMDREQVEALLAASINIDWPAYLGGDI